MTPRNNNQKCELCNERPQEMHFVMYSPPDNVEAELCMYCWSSYEDDYHVAIAILNKRIEEAKKEHLIRAIDLAAKEQEGGE
jgi:hypothetical protein